MDLEHPSLVGLIRAVCDDESVDWGAAASTGSDSFRQTVEELRLVARIAGLHRSLGGATDASLSAASRHSSLPARTGVSGSIRWGHLHLLEHVASGSFGDVYRAWDPAIDREVALKLLKHANTERDLADETIHEGRLLARVRHPNVVSVLGAARVEGRVGIWMEFVPGPTLAQVVERDGPLTATRAAALVTTVCAAVAAVHDAGLLHRDIKAQNVVLGDDGRVVLMDLGAGQAQHDSSSVVAGTPLYLAPEVLAGRPASVQSDVYSLGVLLHFLLTGAFLPIGDGPGTLTSRAGAAGSGRDLQASSAPAVFQRIVSKATARNPRDRYASAAEMATALRSVGGRSLPARSRTFSAIAAALVIAVSVATLALARARFGPAADTSSRGGLQGGMVAVTTESTRRLPWQSLPTGPPSSDGRWIGAVEWDAASGAGVPVVMELATHETHRLWEPTREEAAAAAYATSSSFSPQGERVAIGWRVAGDTPLDEVRVVGVDGTGLQTVLSQTGIQDGSLRVLGWSIDATRVLVMQARYPYGTLFWLDVGDGRRRDVLTVPAGSFASLSPNCVDLALDWPQPGAPDRRDLYIANAETGDLRSLLTEPPNDAMPVWSPDGRHVLFASDRGGPFGAWLVDASVPGSEPVQVSGSMGWWEPVGFGPNRELYYIAQTGTVDVYTARLDLAAQHVDNRSRVATSFSGRNLFSDWSPDSHRLAFTSRRGPINFAPSSQVIVIRNVDSLDERVVRTPFADIGPIRWSPDARSIAIPASGPPKGIWLLSLDTGGLKFAAEAPSERYWSLDWLSSDSLVLVGATAQGPTLFRLSLKTGVSTRLAAGVAAVSVSPDRNLLAMLTREPDGMAVTVASAEEPSAQTQLLRLPHTARPQLAGWTPDGASVLVVQRVDAASEVVRVVALPSSGGTASTVGEAPLGKDLRTVRLSPDGSTLAFESGAPALTTWVLVHPVLAQ